MIKRIVVPVRGDGKGDNVLRHAAVVAHRFSAHIDVVHCRPRPEDLMPFGVPIPAFLKEQVRLQTRDVANAEEQVLKQEYVALTATLGLSAQGETRGASARWVEESGRQVDVIKRHGRLADLIVVAKPDVDRNLGGNTLKAALFHTGRPVLMCPPAAPDPELAKTVAVAWNGSTEAARAVALSMPLICAAESVRILSTGPETDGVSAKDLKEFLALRGVSAAINRFEASGSIAAGLLQQTEACGATLLIMGAYGDSHERETIFGGNTQRVVDTAEMPVLLVH